MWKPTGEDGHVWMAGLDGDVTACQLIKDGYVDATGVQDLYFEAEQAMSAILAAIEAGEAQPEPGDRGSGLRAHLRQHRRARDGHVGLHPARAEVLNMTNERPAGGNPRPDIAIREGGATGGFGHRMRGVFLSDYFVLYLSLAYFAALVPFLPTLATPLNLVEPDVEHVAAAGRGDRPDVRSDHRGDRSEPGSRRGTDERGGRDPAGDVRARGGAVERADLGRVPERDGRTGWAACRGARRSRCSR